MVECLIVGGIVALISAVKNRIEDATSEEKSSSPDETFFQRRNRERKIQDTLQATKLTKSGHIIF